MKAQKQWRCYSLSSLKGVSFLVCLTVEAGKQIATCKASHLLVQPLLFGQKDRGVISFIVTGYEITDPLPESQREAVRSVLAAAIKKGSISSFYLKEIDDGAIRVTAVFEVKANEKFAKAMFETSLEVLNAFHGSDDTEPIVTFEQLSLSLETYVYSDRIWLTEEQVIYRQLDGDNNGLQEDQSAIFQANVDDLF